MASVLPFPDVSYCGQQATEVMIKPTFTTQELLNFVRVLPNIKSKQQVILDNTLEDIIQTAAGCGWTPKGGPMNLTEKFIEVCKIKVNLDQCATDVEGMFMENWLKTGNDEADITATELGDYIIEKVVNALRIDVAKVAWFGDTSSSDETLSVCDGLWTRLLDAVVPYGVTRAFNFGPTLSECEALEGLRAVYDAASDLLYGRPENEVYIAVTRSVFENYRACLEERCCGDRGTILLENGTSTLTFRGIPLRVMPEWDRIIRSKGLGNPHRILYTAKDNLIVGTDMWDDTATLDFWYSKDEDINKIKANFKIATLVLYEELSVIAY